MIWLNGDIVEPNKAKIASNDRGFLLADGLFETMRVDAGLIIQLQDHLDRLRHGMTVLGLVISYDDQQLGTAMKRLLAANALENACLRLTVTRGSGPRGLLPSAGAIPTVIITSAPYFAPSSDPIKMMVSDIRRNEFSPLCNVKALNYLDNILALRDAKSAGFDDAIMLNSKGNVVCTSAANIFLQLGNKLMTPALSEGALPGVTRKSIIESNKAEEGVVSVADLKVADEIFITNSLIGKQKAYL